jgi:hypothetical protein
MHYHIHIKLMMDIIFTIIFLFLFLVIEIQYFNQVKILVIVLFKQSSFSILDYVENIFQLR